MESLWGSSVHPLMYSTLTRNVLLMDQNYWRSVSCTQLSIHICFPCVVLQYSPDGATGCSDAGQTVMTHAVTLSLQSVRWSLVLRMHWCTSCWRVSLCWWHFSLTSISRPLPNTHVEPVEFWPSLLDWWIAHGSSAVPMCDTTSSLAIKLTDRVSAAHTTILKRPSKMTRDHRKCHGSIESILPFHSNCDPVFLYCFPHTVRYLFESRKNLYTRRVFNNPVCCEVVGNSQKV